MAVIALWGIGLGVAALVLAVAAWARRSRRRETYDQVEQFQRFRAAFEQDTAAPPRRSRGDHRPVIRGAD